MIHNEVGSADRCEIIPIGVKPAGGSRGYLVFSTEVSDREKLENLVDRYNELDAIRTEEIGGMSTADFATEPSIRLNNGVCYGEGL